MQQCASKYITNQWSIHFDLFFDHDHDEQIGNIFALTAAHCLYDDDNEELLPATSFSIIARS